MFKYNFNSYYATETTPLPFDHLISFSLPSAWGTHSHYFIAFSDAFDLVNHPV